MNLALWCLLLGSLLLSMGLTGEGNRRWPVTSAMVYLAVGLAIGPSLLHVFHFNPLKQSATLELITEGAVLLSLFTAGVKMPVPLSPRRWHAPLLLAFLAMALTVGFMAAFGHWLLGLSWGAAVLLAAILAPTDPVLATDVQVRHPGDRNRLRFRLTCEAGMNDGSAFPFVMLGLGLLGLHDLGPAWRDWLIIDVAWATIGGIAIGAAAGAAVGFLTDRVRHGAGLHGLWDDFIGLGLIGLVYGLALAANTWGFLAVFFAAVALRQTEEMIERRRRRAGPRARAPRLSDNTLPFKEQLERLSELALVLIVGGTLFLDSWSWRAVATAAVLFLVARPLGVAAALTGSPVPWRQRLTLGWFGVRGIGSLYYLMYAIEHGISEPLALELIHVTLIVITLSILVHGVSVRLPWMRRQGH
ncbi:cation:proton antiporter [Ectothiorhodospiraceae bacterium WFHF3C12]|nr:cation:proton antiporter [Ectothiorhodospiraceae bacterium WFHF3C12]